MTKAQQNVVRDLLEQDVRNLDDWETNFLDSLETNQWDTTLSFKQKNKLHELAKKEGLIE